MIRAGLLRVEPLSDLPAIATVIERYPTRRPDFADASLVWLASVDRIDRIATLDDIDFRVYRMYANKAFVNVFPLS